MFWRGRPGVFRLTAVSGAVLAVALVAACGSNGPTSQGSLPPIETTTTTTSIVVTTTTIPHYYKVHKGDTLRKIAKSFGVSYSELKALNNITNADHIEVGQTLKIPPPTSVAESLPTTTTSTVPATT